MLVYLIILHAVLQKINLKADFTGILDMHYFKMFVKMKSKKICAFSSHCQLQINKSVLSPASKFGLKFPLESEERTQVIFLAVLVVLLLLCTSLSPFYFDEMQLKLCIAFNGSTTHTYKHHRLKECSANYELFFCFQT